MQINHDKVLIQKISLEHKLFTVNALMFLPPKNLVRTNHMAIFTHGYTASKNDLITWATRLADVGITTTLFDLPGHYLGSFNEVESLSDFQLHAFELFGLAFEATKKFMLNHGFIPTDELKLYLGGHSLGALLALKAHSLTNLPPDKIFIGVGLGVNTEIKVHLFDTEFYQKTLNIRKQLVSPHLDPKEIFPWVKNHKHNSDIAHQKIVLICGADDVVVGKGGAKNLQNILSINNDVELIEPTKLPHHEPLLAAGPIFHYIKQFL